MIIKKIINKMKRMNNPSYELDILLENGLVIGKNFRNYSVDVFDSIWPWLITVGDNVCISSNVKIFAHDSSVDYVIDYVKVGTVTIGNNVYIGCNSTILCNTHIGDNVIIGAGSVVTGEIKSNSVYAGNPAKYICSIVEFKKKHINNLDNHLVYEKEWNQFKNISLEEKQQMKKQLENEYGYVKDTWKQ